MAERSDNLQRGLRNSVDWKLVICYTVLIVVGWLSIFSAVQSAEPESIFDFNCNAGKQLVWMIVSMGAGILILFVFSPKLWEAIAPISYLVVLVLLIAVIFLSKDVKGSHSWFELGPVKFQPAEISKITTSLLLATFMRRPNFKISHRLDFIMMTLIVAVPMLTIVAENETGSALVYLGFAIALYREGLTGWVFAFLGAAIVLFILTLTTTNWIAIIALVLMCLTYIWYVLRHSHRKTRARTVHLWRTLYAFIVGLVLIFSSELAFNRVLKEHQRDRIMVLLGMKEDLKGVGYNVHQSMIAIGSGGAFGKGFLQGTQTSYGFVPEQSTDFIFCTIGEEFGFVGCLFVIAVYSMMIFWIIKDAEAARESFTRIYGYCLASCLFMHLLINIGMTIGLMPVIGIPLPLISYGGSSLLAFTVMIFIFIALDRQEKKYY